MSKIKNYFWDEINERAAWREENEPTEPNYDYLEEQNE